jgi:Tfp pilus assembly protein PilV
MNNADARQASTQGATLVELVTAVMIFAIAVLGMVQMSVVATQTARGGELQTDMWSVAQMQFEELQNLSFAAINAGTDTFRGYPVAWTVTGTDPKTVSLMVTRPNPVGTQVVDTFVMAIADWRR